MSCSALACSILRTAPITSLGSTDMPSTKRSGYRRWASMPFGDRPTRAMPDVERVHLLDDPLDDVGALGDDVGHALEHVLGGELHLLRALGVLEVGRKKSYAAFFCSTLV